MNKYYWEEIPARQTSSSSGNRIIALMIILMIVIASGVILIFQAGPFIPTTQGNIKVAVVDSGVDPDFTLQPRLAEQKSFTTVENGYSTDNLNVTDSKPDPDNVAHGTIVSRTVVAQSSNAIIVNAKVIGDAGTATTLGIIAAIHWAVEQNCSVINLSLGSSPSFNDPLAETVEWAFSKGVVVVCAAGNEGQDGVAGTSISSPGVFPHSLAVGGLDEEDIPAFYTSTGPTDSRYNKPDISAPGYSRTSNAIYYGTSFAAPRVSAIVADIIAYCIQNNIEYTPGSIITALLKSAEELDYPDYVVGAGKVDLQSAIELIESEQTDGGLPSISYVAPQTLPVDYEVLFYGDHYYFNVQMFTAGHTVFDVDIDTQTPDVFLLPDEVEINQTGLIRLDINVPDADGSLYEANITFTSQEYGIATHSVRFAASDSVARVAFDISHSTWDIDTIYGQFRELYKELVQNSISVTEIRDSTQTNTTALQDFDAVVILDPCAWDIDESNPSDIELISLPFSQTEIDAYEEYVSNGGGLFITALSNSTLDIDSLNEFLKWTGMSIAGDEIPGYSGVAQVTDINVHPTTVGVSSFDYVGASIIVNQSATTIAAYNGDPVLACQETAGGGKIVLTGTNYFIDNWGMLGQYNSNTNDVLALKIVSWIAGLL